MWELKWNSHTHTHTKAICKCKQFVNFLRQQKYSTCWFLGMRMKIFDETVSIYAGLSVFVSLWLFLGMLGIDKFVIIYIIIIQFEWNGLFLGGRVGWQAPKLYYKHNIWRYILCPSYQKKKKLNNTVVFTKSS